jgi:hypothetical protein
MSETPDSQQSPTPEPGADQPHLHRLLSWRVMRRWLFAAACLATLIGMFYAVEDWRGRRAWEQCRRELEAKGAVLDWNALIPPSVPDEQNVFKAPKMTECFVRGPFFFGSGNVAVVPPEDRAPFTQRRGGDPAAKDVLVAEVKVVTPTIARGAEHAGELLRFEDPAAGDQAAKLLAAATGPCAEGPTACVIVGRPLDQIERAHLVIEAETAPSMGALKQFFIRSQESQAPSGLRIGHYLQVASVGSNLFHVWLTMRVYSAADYLAWTQPTVSDLNVLRKALERPHARMDGNYERPYERPIPNFVLMRKVAQMLAQRAQCYLLLGQSEAAWHELALVREMCRMLEAKPASTCRTLVEAMIDVAITGLYTSIIQDGLRLHVWREPELVAIQQQLADIHLLPLVREAFNAERAASCRTFETTSPAELKKLFSFGSGQAGLWEKFKDPMFQLITFAPRGWMYQNMCVGAPLEQKILDGFLVSEDQILPGKLESIASAVGVASWHRSPYSFLAARALPNFVKASQTMARNQTLVNEAFIACGLERYRLAHGQYPETLAALVPQHAEKLPHDLIGGQALKYRRTAEGRFVLYSVGWNGKDDGGVPGKAADEGDWVWQ